MGATKAELVGTWLGHWLAKLILVPLFWVIFYCTVYPLAVLFRTFAPTSYQERLIKHVARKYGWL